MEKKSEQLFNNLIEKGWCPTGKEYTGPHKPFISSDEDRVHGKQFYYNEWGDGGYRLQKVFTLRELVSINSGLWQFVCKNGMIKNTNIGRYWKDYFELDHIEYYQLDFQYWVLESSLRDESELENFLLQNIKVGNED